MTSNNSIRKLLGGHMYSQINENIIKCHNIFYGGKTLEQKYLSTGNPSLDEILNGGYKKGSLTEISGATNTGKTLLALKAIKEAQKDEKLSIFIDTSRKFNPRYLKDNIIDEDGVFIIQPEYAEKLGILLTEIIKPNIEDIGVIVIDDLANLITKFEKNSSMNKNTDVHKSKVIKALLTRINNLIKNSDTCAIILNQNRSNFLKDGSVTEISSFERWVEMSCDTRLKLSLDEDGDICADVKFKERKF